ncbi:unnamed protein product [Symbiodinium sp. CCMP2456]|nr:unnamed protein product [Symbiodinium sp. CCMP2456]
MKKLLTASPLHREQHDQVVQHFDMEDPVQVADLAAGISSGDRKALQDVLEEKDAKIKIEKVRSILEADLSTAKLQSEVKSKVEEKVAKEQKTKILWEQMRQIQKELGIEKDEKQTLTNQFRDAIQSKEIPEDVQKVIDAELAKLNSLEPSSSEFNVCRTYLEWLTCLPWGAFTTENRDIKHAETVLDEDHYGLEDVKERILEHIAVSFLKELKALVSFEEPEADLAQRLAFDEHGRAGLAPLVASLRAGEPLPELSALRCIVRILGTLAGDPTGDAVLQTHSSGSELAQALRCEVLTSAVMDLLQLRLHSFPKEEQPWMLVEGLRVLRLLLVVPGDAKEAAWWLEDSCGLFGWSSIATAKRYTAYGNTRRRLGQVLVSLMELMKASYPRKADMKVAAFCALQSLALNSPESLRHLAQLHAANAVVALLQAQIQALPSAAAFAEGLRALVALSAGLHLRRVMEADAVNIAVELLKRMEAHREVVAAGFVLLAIVAEEHGNLDDETWRLAEEAAKTWPKEVKQDLCLARRPLSAGFRALLPAEPK